MYLSMPLSLAKPLTTFEFTWTCLGSGAWLTAVVPGAASKVMVDCVHSTHRQGAMPGLLVVPTYLAPGCPLAPNLLIVTDPSILLLRDIHIFKT